MAEGKMHSRLTRLFINGYDVSADSSVLEMNQPGDIADCTGFGQDRREYRVGILDQNIVHNGWFNDGTAGVHTVLKDLIGSSVQLAYCYGTIIGDYAFAGSAVMENNYSVGADLTRAVGVVSNFVNNSATEPVRVARVAQGRTIKSASGNAGVSIDGGAQSTAGGRGFLQALNIIGAGSWTFYLLDSADDSTFAGIGTFTQIGSAATPTTEVITTVTTVDQYVRGSWALDGTGTADFWLGFARL